MKTFIFLILFILPGPGWGQEVKCKIKADEFTKDTSIVCDDIKFGKSKRDLTRGLLFIRGGMYTFKSLFILNLIPEFYSVQSFDEGDIVYLKFEDSTVLQLKVFQYSLSDHKSGEIITQGSDNTIWYNYLTFVLKPQDIMTLELKKVEKIRCGHVDYSINKKDLILKMIRCIKEKK